MTQPDDAIEEGHAGCLCPLCDNEICAWEAHTVLVAHGSKYIVHQICFDALADAEDGPEEGD